MAYRPPEGDAVDFDFADALSGTPNFDFSLTEGGPPSILFKGVILKGMEFNT
jgi:hypothetical protein